MSGFRSDPAPGTPAATPEPSAARTPGPEAGPTPAQNPPEPACQTPLAVNPEAITATAKPAAASVGEASTSVGEASTSVGEATTSGSEASTGSTAPRKGPLSFLSGALTSGALAWGCFWLSRRVVAYYSLHPPHYEARVAQSIATALKTLIVGMTFLATFSFAFVGLGLTLVFVRSLLRPEPRSPA